jgi:hypothetical protein
MQKLLDLFRQPTDMEMAAKELAEAKRELLQCQTMKDYSSRMVEYNTDRVKRLEALLRQASCPAG